MRQKKEAWNFQYIYAAIIKFENATQACEHPIALYCRYIPLFGEKARASWNEANVTERILLTCNWMA